MGRVGIRQRQSSLSLSVYRGVAELTAALPDAQSSQLLSALTDVLDEAFTAQAEEALLKASKEERERASSRVRLHW